MAEYQVPAEETGPVAPAPATESNPIPEKFGGDVAKLADAYKELERRMSGGDSGSEVTPEVPPVSQEVTPDTPDPQSLTIEPKTPEEVDRFQEFAQRWAESGGQLEEADLDAFSKETKVPRQFVERYLEGEMLRQEKAAGQIFDAVGGREAYGQAVAWAQDNMNPQELEAYNQAVSGSPEMATIAAQGLMSRYSAANGNSPQLLRGTSGQVSEPAYTHMDQALNAMRDPRYKTDQTFRDTVAKRMRNL